MNAIKISVIIITRNRQKILCKCLNPLQEQLKKQEGIEVIIIDNNSTDSTVDFLKDFTNKNPKFLYKIEKNIGASFARNAGITMAKGNWLCFLDDDGIPDVDFIEQLNFTIDNYKFDGFGGMWYPYADKVVPSWIPKEVTTMRLLTKKTDLIPYGECVAAGICAFKKDIVIQAGCFPSQMGPRNGKMGYGEENFLQQEIWKLGGTIGFNPAWTMKHYVSNMKFKLWWNLERYYLKGRDSSAFLPRLAFGNKISESFKIVLLPLYLLVINASKMIMNKNYLWQNWILDSFRYSFKMYGRLTAKDRV